MHARLGEKGGRLMGRWGVKKVFYKKWVYLVEECALLKQLDIGRIVFFFPLLISTFTIMNNN